MWLWNYAVKLKAWSCKIVLYRWSSKYCELLVIEILGWNLCFKFTFNQKYGDFPSKWSGGVDTHFDNMFQLIYKTQNIFKALLSGQNILTECLKNLRKIFWRRSKYCERNPEKYLERCGEQYPVRVKSHFFVEAQVEPSASCSSSWAAKRLCLQGKSCPKPLTALTILLCVAVYEVPTAIIS